MKNLNSTDLTKENNLYDIYKASRKLPGSIHNQVPTIFIFIALLAYAVFSDKTVSSLAQEVRAWSELGFNFSTTILGFLISGFAIFATISKPNLFIKLAETLHRKSQLSYLKYNFFTLINVFILYVWFASYCLAIKLLATPDGVIASGLNLIFLSSPYLYLAKRILVGTGIVTVGTWFFYLILILQSFIFNIYYIVMTTIRWEIEIKNSREGESNKDITGNRN